MESVNNEHRNSIGKFLRKKKSLRSKDPNFIREDVPPKLQDYLDLLHSKGARMNKVSVGRFKTKNNLEYTGIFAKEEINSDQILMEIPQKLLLTTRHAWFSPMREVFKQHLDFFSPHRASGWEDRMLLTYLIYEYSRGKESEWYYLLDNLPREIDYVIFWDESELTLLEDESLQRSARGVRRSFEEEAAELIKIARQHPELMQPEAFTYDNIRWIYTHITTRCFGNYFQYVTMVPMAELFNHECTDVYYDFRHNEDNPHKPADENFPEPKKLTQDEIDGFDTSDGSYDSVERDRDSDFEYDDHISEFALTSTKKKALEDDDSLFMGEVKAKIQETREYVTTQLNWCDTLTVFYIKEVLNHLDELEKRHIAGKMKLSAVKKELAAVEGSITTFREMIWRHYKEVLNMKDDEIKLGQLESGTRGKGKGETDPNKEFKDDEDWAEDKMDHFIMKASSQDQFEQGSQVYFCYGRLSNRKMLLRYGMALEYNKYDHVHFKLPYFSYIDSNAWLISKLKEHKVSKFKKLKARRRSFNPQLVNFYKAAAWRYKSHSIEELLEPKNSDLELIGLEGVKKLFDDYLSSCKHGEAELEKMLYDENIGYHEYFAVVFNLERQRCIRFHFRATLVLIEIMRRLTKSLKLNFALVRVDELETEEEFHRNRFFLSKYINRLRLFHQ